jgi:hypothetical protein
MSCRGTSRATRNFGLDFRLDGRSDVVPSDQWAASPVVLSDLLGLMAGRWQGPIERQMFAAEMSIVRVYLPLNSDVKCLGSACTSDIPMLDRMVTVGHEGD